MKRLSLLSRQRTDWLPIGSAIRAAVRELKVRDGILTIFVPHTTAAVTINEGADPDVLADLTRALDRIVPWNADYAHAEGNSAAHIKASLIGSSVRVPVREGELHLGTWQEIFFCEFDGPREREVWVLADPL